MKRPNTRVTLHAGTPAALKRELSDFLHALNPTDQVAITIAVTPPNTPPPRVRDTRGAPSKPGPADPTTPMDDTLLEAAARARGNI